MLKHNDTVCPIYDNDEVLPDEKGDCSLCGAKLVPTYKKPTKSKRFRVVCYTEVGGYIELEAGSALEAEATAIKMLEDIGDSAFTKITNRQNGKWEDSEEI